MNSPKARDYSQEERERLAKKGHALPDGSYPIVDREDLENAIQAIGRAKDPDKAKAHIKKRARELGLEELIPEEWSSVDKNAIRDRLRRPLARAQSGRGDDWYRIQNKAGETPALYIYEEIGYFGDSAKGLVDQLNTVDGGQIDVHLNSPGGDIFDGLAIYQALKNHPAKITVRIDGLAASIASVIAMAGDKVVMAPKASMMIHDGWTVACGNAAELHKMANLLDTQSQIIASVYADRSNSDAEFWRTQMRQETWYTAEEALEAGLIDEIEGKEKKVDDPFDLSVFAHAGRENAPEPVTKPQLKGEDGPEVLDISDDIIKVSPVVDKKDEPEPFVWDFAAFKSALQEGVKQ